MKPKFKVTKCSNSSLPLSLYRDPVACWYPACKLYPGVCTYLQRFCFSFLELPTGIKQPCQQAPFKYQGSFKKICDHFWRLVFTRDRVEVIIRSIELYDLGKTAFWFFWFHLRLSRLWSSENWLVRVASRSEGTKPIIKRGNMHCDWFILLLLLPTSTIWFSLDHKQRSRKRSWRKMETFWFF